MEKEIKEVLNALYQQSIQPEQAFEIFKDFPFKDIGDIKVDLQRKIRRGHPEAILCKGKSLFHIQEIVDSLPIEDEELYIFTKITKEVFDSISKKNKFLKFYPQADLMILGKKTSFKINTQKKIYILTGGVADAKIAEEASITCQSMGCPTKKIFDIGIAGLSRLIYHLDEIQRADILIVIAGMDAALPTVVSGLTEVPLLAVPTSIGYGASLAGISALLSMLNSCSPGISVFNIDNGFGAGYFASLLALS